MSPRGKGIMLGAAHLGLALLLAGRYQWDRARLPRAWAEAEPANRNQPIRGRYLRLLLKVDLAPEGAWKYNQTTGARLFVRNGRLMAAPEAASHRLLVRVPPVGQRGILAESLAFFLPEHSAGRLPQPPEDGLVVEVSVPERGLPRPIRLGVRRGEAIEPLSTDRQPR